jgi:hypothetical protein
MQRMDWNNQVCHSEAVMESIYYVLCWHCHRRCKHCYEERFSPYVRDELAAVVAEAVRNAPRIIANLPARLSYVEDGVERAGRIILSGGDVLTEPVRERVLYPTLQAIRDKYREQGGVRVIVQTTGDLLTPKILDELLALGVNTISVAGMDDYHVGMEGDKRQKLIDKLLAMFQAAGLQNSALFAARRLEDGTGPAYFNMFGATEDAWIGKLWPRGRAWQNGLSTATLEDNFCNAWSGGLNFLNHGQAGSEVSIDPTGDVYPCCLKTAHPLGNLTEEPLLEILDHLASQPAIQAINAGAPEKMGLAHGWSEARFLEASHTTSPDGRPYQNLCIGCDRFHEEVLGKVLDGLYRERRARRHGVLARSGADTADQVSATCTAMASHS